MIATVSLPPVETSHSVNGTAPSVLAPIAELMVITPQIAAELLKGAHPNRPVSRTRVRAIAEAIRQGLWQVNGETIILDEHGKLIDGQHRLLAVIEAGQSIETMVASNIDPSTFTSIDQGQKKSGVHVLRMMQIDHAGELSSALRWVYRYEHDCMLKSAIGLLDYQLPQYLAQHPGLPASLGYGTQTRALVPQGVGTALHYLMTQKDQGLADRFCEQLGKGEHLETKDAAWQLRNKFLGDKQPLHHKTVAERAALLVLAFNCQRRRLPFDVSMKWKGLSNSQIPFPQIV